MFNSSPGSNDEKQFSPFMKADPMLLLAEVNSEEICLACLELIFFLHDICGGTRSHITSNPLQLL